MQHMSSRSALGGRPAAPAVPRAGSARQASVKVCAHQLLVMTDEDGHAIYSSGYFSFY